MNIKTIVGAGFAALLVAGVSSGAEAKKAPHSHAHFELFPFGERCLVVGIHRNCAGMGYGGPGYYDEPWNDYPVISHRLTCDEARFRVRERGFKKISTKDCSGKSYSFTASKNGARYLVKVNAHTGRVKASAL